MAKVSSSQASQLSTSSSGIKDEKRDSNSRFADDQNVYWSDIISLFMFRIRGPLLITHGFLNKYDLQTRDVSSPYCREPFIYFGYRPNPSSASYCLKSVFYPTNETLNIWTHFIPLLFMTYHYWKFITVDLQIHHSFLFYPYWFFVAGVLSTLLGSTLAHIFNSLSLGAREVCFCCDYCSIALQAIGFTAAFNFYLCSYTCLQIGEGVSIMIYYLLLFGNAFCVYCSCKTRQHPDMPYRDIARVLPYVVLFIILIIPCIYKYSITTIESDCSCLCGISPACFSGRSQRHSSLFFFTCLTLSLGALVHACKIPERFFPGSFDIVGHSHQIFHIFTFLGLYFESLLIEETLMELVSCQKDEGCNTFCKKKPKSYEVSSPMHLCEQSVDKFFMTETSTVIAPALCILLSFAIGLRYSMILYRMRSGETKTKKKN